MAKRKKKGNKRGLILFTVEVIILVVLVSGIFVYAKINEGLRNIGTSDQDAASQAEVDPNLDVDEAGENEGISDNEVMHGYTNIALVGLDTRDSNTLDYANSDTMIIASINNDTKQVRMVSLYRDTLLNIEPDGTTDQGGDGSDLVSEEDIVDDSSYYESSDEDSSYNDSSNDVVGTDYDYDDYEDDDYDDYDYDDDDDYDYYYEDDDEDYEDSSYASDDSLVGSSSEYSVGGTYDKANAAYNLGSAKQMLTMMNMNFDLDIHDYVVVNFQSVAKLVDDLGGLDMSLLHDEVVMINDYCVGTSEVIGNDYTPLEVPPDDGSVNEFHLDGTQAVSYARIRYTTGNDPKRTERQRVVIQKIVEKAQSQGLNAVTAIINDVLPLCKTSLSSAEIIKMATYMMDYEIEKTTGFPFAHLEKDVYPAGKKRDAVVPVTLEQNVIELHAFLFDEENYVPTDTVKAISNDIITISDLGTDDIERARAASEIPSIGGETDEMK